VILCQVKAFLIVRGLEKKIVGKDGQKVPGKTNKTKGKRG
jgi:hypothetical protein